MSTTGEIRGCTLHRPWPGAFLLPERTIPGDTAQVLRPKRVENRDWYPKWACRPMSEGTAVARPGIYLALHAWLQVDDRALVEVWRWGWPELRRGEASVIVAVCRLARVLDCDMGFNHPLIRAHRPWAMGRYLWEVDQVAALPEPVACKGAQGLWPLPPEVLARVRMQWAAATTRGE